MTYNITVKVAPGREHDAVTDFRSARALLSSATAVSDLVKTDKGMAATLVAPTAHLMNRAEEKLRRYILRKTYIQGYQAESIS